MLLWLHVPGLSLFALAEGKRLTHAAVEAGIVAVPALAAQRTGGAIHATSTRSVKMPARVSTITSARALVASPWRMISRAAPAAALARSAMTASGRGVDSGRVARSTVDNDEPVARCLPPEPFRQYRVVVDEKEERGSSPAGAGAAAEPTVGLGPGDALGARAGSEDRPPADQAQGG